MVQCIESHAEYINGVTNSEYVYLVSTVKALYDKGFNCYFCKKAHRSKETVRGLRKNKGCFEISEKRKWVYENVRYYTCIGNFYSPQAAQLWEIFMNYEKGIMPFPGSYMDQPAKIIDVFQLMGSIRDKEVERKHEEEKRQAKIKGK